MQKNLALCALAAIAALSSQAALARVNVDIGIGVPGPVYVAPQPVIVAPGYYDDERGREWQERQWREQRWREREWRKHHRRDDYDD